MDTRWLGAVTGLAILLGGQGVSAQDPAKQRAADDQRRMEAKAKALGLEMDYDHAPVPTHRQRPKYPKDAFDHRVEGTVQTLVAIDAKGRVADVEVLESVPGLDAAAVDCVEAWRFEPATKNGVSVGTVALMPIEFRIYDQRPDSH